MGEDDSCIRKDNAPESMAVLRRIALNLLGQKKTSKRGIAGRRLKAALSPDYFLKVLSILYANALLNSRLEMYAASVIL